MTALLADMAVWTVYALGAGMMVVGVAGAFGLAWLGAWLLARRRQATHRPDEVR